MGVVNFNAIGEMCLTFMAGIASRIGIFHGKRPPALWPISPGLRSTLPGSIPDSPSFREKQIRAYSGDRSKMEIPLPGEHTPIKPRKGGEPPGHGDRPWYQQEEEYSLVPQFFPGSLQLYQAFC